MNFMVGTHLFLKMRMRIKGLVRMTLQRVAQGGVSAPQTPSPAMSTTPKITTKQKDTIYKLHVNTGHLPVPQMLAMLKAAGARDEVRDFVKNEFHCFAVHEAAEASSSQEGHFSKELYFQQAHWHRLFFHFIFWERPTPS